MHPTRALSTRLDTHPHPPPRTTHTHSRPSVQSATASARPYRVCSLSTPRPTTQHPHHLRPARGPFGPSSDASDRHRCALLPSLLPPPTDLRPDSRRSIGATERESVHSQASCCSGILDSVSLFRVLKVSARQSTPDALGADLKVGGSAQGHVETPYQCHRSRGERPL